jgi:hypothetical protein
MAPDRNSPALAAKVINAGEDQEIGDIAVETFPPLHDALDRWVTCVQRKKSVGIAPTARLYHGWPYSRRAHCLVLEPTMT